MTFIKAKLLSLGPVSLAQENHAGTRGPGGIWPRVPTPTSSLHFYLLRKKGFLSLLYSSTRHTEMVKEEEKRPLCTVPKGISVLSYNVGNRGNSSTRISGLVNLWGKSFKESPHAYSWLA